MSIAYGDVTFYRMLLKEKMIEVMPSPFRGH